MPACQQFRFAISMQTLGNMTADNPIKTNAEDGNQGPSLFHLCFADLQSVIFVYISLRFILLAVALYLLTEECTEGCIAWYPQAAAAPVLAEHQREDRL